MLIFTMFCIVESYAQIQNEYIIAGGAGLTLVPRDSVASVGVQLTVGNRLEFFRVNDNLAFDVHTNIKWQGNYPSTSAYGAEVLFGLDLFGKNKDVFPFGINYSWGYVYMGYRSKRVGNIFTLKGLNFHQLYFHNVLGGHVKDSNTGLFLEYFGGYNDDKYFGIGIIISEIWFPKKRKRL